MRELCALLRRCLGPHPTLGAVVELVWFEACIFGPLIVGALLDRAGLLPRPTED